MNSVLCCSPDQLRSTKASFASSRGEPRYDFPDPKKTTPAPKKNHNRTLNKIKIELEIAVNLPTSKFFSTVNSVISQTWLHCVFQ